MVVMTTWKKMTGLIKQVGFNWFLELSRMRRKQRGSRMTRLIKLIQNAKAHVISLSPSVSNFIKLVQRSRDPAVVEAAEMWSVGCLPQVGHYGITEHEEWQIDTSARRYFALERL